MCVCRYLDLTLTNCYIDFRMKICLSPPCRLAFVLCFAQHSVSFGPTPFNTFVNPFFSKNSSANRPIPIVSNNGCIHLNFFRQIHLIRLSIPQQIDCHRSIVFYVIRKKWRVTLHRHGVRNYVEARSRRGDEGCPWRPLM